jgi:site-specific DNA recombinase
VNSFPYYNRVLFVLRKCTNHFRNMNSEVKLMICVDQNGQAVEISVADQMWLDDAYFKEKQLRLGTDAPRAALAYRVSTKGQVDHDDIPMQKIDCRKFAQKQGWRVVKEVAERGVSGSKVSASKRDAIQQLKEEAANGEFDILLVYMFDRLGRIESETPFVLEWFVQHGIEMWSTHEGQQKIETHGDKLMNYIRFWQAAGESEKTSIRTRDRIRQIVSSGHYTGGFVCYGYQLADQGRRNKRDKPVMDLIVNEEEAAWVRELFYKVVHEGASGYALAEMLNNRGLRTRAGAKFQSSNILRIIRHEGYTGYIITKNARSEYISELQIIDQETFEKANDIISRRSAKTAQDRRIAHTRRVLSTAPTVERRCPVLCTQTATSWRMVAFGRKYNQSTIAFSGDRRIKGGEIATDRHYILLSG